MDIPYLCKYGCEDLCLFSKQIIQRGNPYRKHWYDSALAAVFSDHFLTNDKLNINNRFTVSIR